MNDANLIPKNPHINRQVGKFANLCVNIRKAEWYIDQMIDVPICVEYKCSYLEVRRQKTYEHT